MASACVNNIGVPPENFLDCAPAFPPYGWLSPRISFSREYTDKDSKLFAADARKPQPPTLDAPDPSKDAGDFEFRLDDPVAMLPADELFSDGKLVPLQLTAVVRPAAFAATAAPVSSEERAKSPEARKNEVESLSSDPYLFSPKAPRCSSRWRDLLGLKKLYQNKANSTSNATMLSSTSTTTSSPSNTGKSIRHFLHKSSKSLSASSFSVSDASLNCPLLKDSDCESLSISSSRLSLSSSSSGHDHDDLPRLSVDADIKPSQSHISLPRCSSGPSQCLAHRKVKMVKPRMVPASVAENPKNRVGRSPIRRAQPDPPHTVTRGASVDSPRMSSSGKIVFQGLERSSSSPSSFNGGPRYKHRGMERSYSANVRVAPVLNVPVCSLRGSSKSGVFGLFSSSSQSQKKDGNSGNSTTSKTHHHHHHYTGRTRRGE